MPRYKPPERIDAERCKGCELCVVVCRRKVLTMAETLNTRGNRVATVDPGARCDRCGRCFLICPDGAIIERSSGPDTVNSDGPPTDPGGA